MEAINGATVSWSNPRGGRLAALVGGLQQVHTVEVEEQGRFGTYRMDGSRATLGPDELLVGEIRVNGAGSTLYSGLSTNEALADLHEQADEFAESAEDLRAPRVVRSALSAAIERAGKAFFDGADEIVPASGPSGEANRALLDAIRGAGISASTAGLGPDEHIGVPMIEVSTRFRGDEGGGWIRHELPADAPEAKRIVEAAKRLAAVAVRS